jgi:phosphatidylglycerophosphatase C
LSRAIAFFDFDGTITTSDSLAEFIRYQHGSAGFLTGLIPVIPTIIGFKAGLVNRQHAKEKLMSAFFSGKAEQTFEQLANTFAQEKIPSILRPLAMAKLDWHKQQAHEIVIVSASPTQWLQPWCHAYGFKCIATELEIVDGKITGKIRGKNCHGEEKVRRIREKYTLSDYTDIYAYGDTSGDKPMLALASHSYYKPFR